LRPAFAVGDEPHRYYGALTVQVWCTVVQVWCTAVLTVNINIHYSPCTAQEKLPHTVFMLCTYTVYSYCTRTALVLYSYCTRTVCPLLHRTGSFFMMLVLPSSRLVSLLLPLYHLRKIVLDQHSHEIELQEVWCIVYGVWCRVYGVWCRVYGVWCMSVWCMVYECMSV
jgi:hypothetical protein